LAWLSFDRETVSAMQGQKFERFVMRFLFGETGRGDDE
jgi:hypothetical protein